MKKMITTPLVCILGAFMLLVSCERDPQPQTGPLTKTEMLTTGQWKFSAAFVSAIDVSAQLQACQKDNILTFSALGTGIINEGLLKCNASDPDNTAFTWQFNPGKTEITISTILFTGGTNTFKLITLTQSSLVVSQMVSLGGGAPQEVIVNFTH